LIKLVQQIAAGPPSTLLQGWTCPPTVLFINKQDKLPEDVRTVVLKALAQQLCALAPFARVFTGAAMLGQGVRDLKQYLVSQVSCCCC
jgi:GTPase Era involved in 16S rRNA processing